MKEAAAAKTKVVDSSKKAIAFIARHRVTLMIMAVGAVVGLSLFRVMSYGAAARNEELYSQLTSEQAVISVDEELLGKIESSIDNDTTSVVESTTPGRTNPFTE